MPDRAGFVVEEVFKEQTTYEIFRNRLVIFIIAVAALIAAFAWNHLGTIGIRDKLDEDPVRAALIYAVLMTMLFVVIILVVAVLYKKIYGF